MSKLKVGDRVAGRYDHRDGDITGTILIDKEDVTGFLLIQRDDEYGWDAAGSPEVNQYFPHLLGLKSLWWIKEKHLTLGGPKPIYDGYDIDA